MRKVPNVAERRRALLRDCAIKPKILLPSDFVD